MSWWLIALLAWLAPGVVVSLALLWTAWLVPMVSRKPRAAAAADVRSGPEHEPVALSEFRVRSGRSSALLAFRRRLRRPRVGDRAVREPGRRRQAGGIDPVAAHQVEDAAAAREQIVGDDPAVTAPPDGLGAHDCAAAAGA